MVAAGLVEKWLEDEVHNLRISRMQQEREKPEADNRPLTMDHLQVGDQYISVTEFPFIAKSAGFLSYHIFPRFA